MEGAPQLGGGQTIQVPIFYQLLFLSCAPGGTASGDDDAAAVVQRLQPVEEVGVMAGAVDCGGQHCGFCGDHGRERLPQELRHLHWSIPRPPLLSALQGKPCKAFTLLCVGIWSFRLNLCFGIYWVFTCGNLENFSCGLWGTAGVAANPLEKMGALDVQRVVHRHQGWQLISFMWLHAGVFHMLANMLSLVFIGIRLEQEFGFVRIGFLYLMSGFGGSLLSALIIQYGISVGASGALFGLLGSMLSELISNWTMYVNKYVHDPFDLTVSDFYPQLAALLTLLFIIIINLAVGILPHVDNFAHIGGFVSGFLLGFLFLIRPQFNPTKCSPWTLCTCLFLIRMVWRRHCVIAVLCVVLIGHFVDNGFYFVVLGCMCWQVYSWPGYSFSRGQSKQSLFLVSLFELCPYVKMELQVTKYLLCGLNNARLEFAFGSKK
ncbi:hypothetical protein DVH24_032913 [Malus domestica]|uniref:RHOMBOID-like protein n=1 Tax=Malus domestica TaxID=3750 RepID=A0A498IN92_MALDO|nr:hypothetical protein DVH24_032913 [Malus domestica]